MFIDPWPQDSPAPEERNVLVKQVSDEPIFRSYGALKFFPVAVYKHQVPAGLWTRNQFCNKKVRVSTLPSRFEDPIERCFRGAAKLSEAAG
jgi:hypothetical protein